LYVNKPAGPVPLGTGFLYADVEDRYAPKFVYLLTARHVIEFARWRHGAAEIRVRINSSDGSSVWVDIPIDHFLGHPADDTDANGLPLLGEAWLRRDESRTRVDLAASLVPIETVNSVDFYVWPQFHSAPRILLANEGIDPGYEVAIAGLYRNHIGRDRNIPIIRSGILSAMPEEPVSTLLGPSNVYLIEARSVGGLSGSPVFVFSGERRLTEGKAVMRHAHNVWFLGVIHGHFDVAEADSWDTAWGRERMNEGIAMVTPCDEIPDLIHREEFMSVREAESRREEGES
jgi:hypothetical protein